MSVDKFIKPLADFGPAVVFYAIAAHHLIKYLEGKGELGSAIQFAVLGTVVFLGFRFIRIIVEAVQDRLKESIADWIVRWLGKVWLHLFDSFQAEYYKSIVYAFRVYRTQGLKTTGPFTFDLSKIFVPLRIAPERADSVSSALIQKQKESKNIDWEIWKLLDKPKKNNQDFRKPKLAIIGPPGSGKSTLLEHLALTYAEQKQKKKNKRALKLIPILFRLKDIHKEVCVEPPSLLGDSI